MRARLTDRREILYTRRGREYARCVPRNFRVPFVPEVGPFQCFVCVTASGMKNVRNVLTRFPEPKKLTSSRSQRRRIKSTPTLFFNHNGIGLLRSYGEDPNMEQISEFSKIVRTVLNVVKHQTISLNKPLLECVSPHLQGPDPAQICFGR